MVPAAVFALVDALVVVVAELERANVVVFVAVRSSVGHWRLHRSCNPIRGVSEPESRRDTGRRGAERQEKQQREAKIAPAAPDMRIFGLALAPLSQA